MVGGQWFRAGFLFMFEQLFALIFHFLQRGGGFCASAAAATENKALGTASRSEMIHLRKITQRKVYLVVELAEKGVGLVY